MEILRLVVGDIMTNCYIVWDTQTKDAMVIDPGGDGLEIQQRISKHGLKVRYIVNTHAHIDHIAANEDLKHAYPDAQLLIHELDAPALTDPSRNLSLLLNFRFKSPPADRLLKDGDEIVLGRYRFRVIHTPGHSAGGISLYCDGIKPPVLFCGDTLFQFSVGRTDFPGGSFETLANAIRERLFVLPDETVVYPGHGPETTIGEEKRHNPFVGGVR